MAMKILLITPPLLQPNTPYAATPLLTAYLRSIGHEAEQADLSLQLLLRLFSRAGLIELFDVLKASRAAREFVLQREAYLQRVEPVVAFLQGRNPSLAYRIGNRGFLPEGPHLSGAFDNEDQLGYAFGTMGLQDRARYLATMFLDDIAEAAKFADEKFGFARYAEKLAVSLSAFEPMRAALETAPTLFDRWQDEHAQKLLVEKQPELVAITIPFPGCLYGALRMARAMKKAQPDVQITIGGGYVNTELRELSDPSIFDYVDTITLDSGMVPLRQLANQSDQRARTFSRINGRIIWQDCVELAGVQHSDLPAPSYDGLPLADYLQLFEMLNPVNRLWSDGRWNKLVLAHGCHWHRCAFCDTSIDYICRYDPADAVTICDWIERVIAETGQTGFHFVDEALPPNLVDPLCDEILRRKLTITWWGNLRFESRFSEKLIRKMAAAGCIAVTGGLETGCDRTLKLMQKGIQVESAARVMELLADEGILVHTYLMYGFPTQTFDETLDALDVVRQLFAAGILHSAYWHRFALTAHSEVSENPDKFGIEILPNEPGGFALNEVPFDGHFDYDLDSLGLPLKTATYNFMHHIGLDDPVDRWF
jgi:hypothetical protein